MKRAIVLVAACAAHASPARAPAHAQPTDQLTIHFHAPPAGARFHELRETTLVADRSGGHLETMGRIDKTIELVAIDRGGAVTAKQVRFDFDRHMANVAGKASATTSGVEGHTYRIEGGAVHDEAGDPVGDDIAAEVKRGEPLGPLEGAFEKFLDGRTFVVGEAVTVPLDAIAELVPTEGASGTAQLALRGARGGVATFDVSVRLTFESGDDLIQTIAVDSTGTIGIDLSLGMIRTMAIAGTTKADGPSPVDATETVQDERTLER
jgi:hypothetical protein